MRLAAAWALRSMVPLTSHLTRDTDTFGSEPTTYLETVLKVEEARFSTAAVGDRLDRLPAGSRRFDAVFQLP